MISVTVSQDSRYALVNHRPNEAQLWDIEEQYLVASYHGHRIQKDLVRACFVGSTQSFIASGSEGEYERCTGPSGQRLTYVPFPSVLCSLHRCIHLHLPPHFREAPREAQWPWRRDSERSSLASQASLLASLVQR